MGGCIYAETMLRWRLMPMFYKKDVWDFTLEFSYDHLIIKSYIHEYGMKNCGCCDSMF